ncbi:MAG TPA: TldD/PmbA family protein [Methanomassiliicoccales archaeon]|nr:TldD/PmbA family protein [Methanomassiliicoccales archaeon]
MRLQDIAEEALRAAKGDGSDEAEAYVTSARAVSVYVDGSKLKSVELRSDIGISVRVIKGLRVGQSSRSVAEVSDAAACGRDAAKVTKCVPKDPVFMHFPYPEKARSPGAGNSSMASLEPEELAHHARDVVHAATAGKKTSVPKGLARAYYVEGLVVNSNGVHAPRKTSGVYMHFTTMTLGSSRGEGEEYHFGTSLSDFDAEVMGKALKRKALDASRAKAFKGTMKADVLLQPQELAELLRGSVGFALNAENVNRKRSPWIGQVGKEVASSLLTIEDDPSNASGILCSPFDDEGVPSTRKKLLENGALKALISDHYNALLTETPATGNGVRRSAMEPMYQYSSPVRIAPMCAVISPGNKRPDEIVAEMESGLIVQKFSAPEVQPITGALALEVRCAQVVNKGEIVGTVDHCLLTGNMYEALRHISHVGSDATVSAGMNLPSLSVGGLELVGSG